MEGVGEAGLMSDLMDCGDSDSVEMVKCGNCKKEVPVCNFTMHEIHCRRNLSLCEKCDGVINKTDMEMHLETMHKIVTCDFGCGREVEFRNHEFHLMNECILRIVVCRFCELEIKERDLADHEYVCGSRTEFCNKCKKYVLLRDLQDHDDLIDCSLVNIKKKKSLHVDEQEQRMRLVESRLDSIRESAILERRGESTIQHSDPTTTTPSDIHLPCEFCGIEFPSNTLLDHQAVCFLTNKGASRRTEIDVDEYDRALRNISSSFSRPFRSGLSQGRRNIGHNPKRIKKKPTPPVSLPSPGRGMRLSGSKSRGEKAKPSRKRYQQPPPPITSSGLRGTQFRGKPKPQPKPNPKPNSFPSYPPSFASSFSNPPHVPSFSHSSTPLRTAKVPSQPKPRSQASPLRRSNTGQLDIARQRIRAKQRTPKHEPK